MGGTENKHFQLRANATISLSQRLIRNIPVEQNAQFFITVGTIIAVFLWLRNDINRLDAKIDRVYDSLKGDINNLSGEVSSVRGEINSVRGEVSSIRESLAWLRGRLGYGDANPDDSAH